jgi:hypothetical protein
MKAHEVLYFPAAASAHSATEPHGKGKNRKFHTIRFLFLYFFAFLRAYLRCSVPPRRRGVFNLREQLAIID